MIAAGVLGILLLAGLMGWVFLPGTVLPLLPSSARPEQTPPGQMVNREELPAQRSGESALARTDPAGNEGPTGGRARAIRDTAQPLTLSEDQRNQVRSIISRQSNPPRLQETPFELQIGTAVPRQVPTGDLPAEITEVMNGYWGARYVLVQDKLVIVDLRSGRVAAIVPGMPEAANP